MTIVHHFLKLYDNQTDIKIHQSYRYYVVYVCRIVTTDMTGTTLFDDVKTFNNESALCCCIVSVLFCCCVLIAYSII